MNGDARAPIVQWSAFLLAFCIGLLGALAYMHATFVTYREFTLALERLRLLP